MAQIKEPDRLISWQPGYLLTLRETRGFPSPLRSGFGFISGIYTIAQSINCQVTFNKIILIFNYYLAYWLTIRFGLDI
jgi:hypothetical protein